jgi:uncharacterized membrane protein
MPFFINPALLAGLGLISIPIIIHLLQKNRVKEMEWAAMQFLLEIVEEQNKKIQLEDLLLLLLRILFFTFLALAVARPIINFNSGGLVASSGEVVILVDDSYSMGTASGAETRFEIAKKRALKIVAAQPKGYGISVVRFDQYSSSIMGGFSADKELLLESVKKMKPSHLNGNIESGLDYALSLFKNKETKKLIFLVSDFQELDWKNPTEAFLKKLKEVSTDKQTSLFFIPVTDSEKENLAVESVSATQAAVKVNQKATIVGVIRNFGTEASKDSQIDLVVNGTLRDSKLMIVPAGQSANILFDFVPEQEGDQKVEVKVRHDKVAQDNSCFFSLKVLDKLKILAVLDATPSRNEFNDLTVVDLALNPFKLRSRDEKALYSFKYIGISDLVSEELNNYDLILMGNISSVIGIEAKALEDYVRQGGGVLMFLGDKVKPFDYNENLYQDGKGIWSMKLSEKLLEQTENRVLEVLGESKEHPIWQYTLSDGRNYLNPLMVYKSFGFEGKPGKDTIVLATVKSDKVGPLPMMVDFTYGKGHFLVYGSTSTLKWGQFAIHPVFVTVMNQSIKYLRSFHSSETNLPVYSDYKKIVGLDESQSNYHLETPSGETFTLSVLNENNSYEVKLKAEMIKEQGFYLLKNVDTPDKKEFLSVNLDIREGDIKCTEPGVIESTFKPLGVVVDLTGDELSTSLGKIEPTMELATIFLILAFLCWVAENLLAYRITTRA